MRVTQYDAAELEARIGPRGGVIVKSSGEGENRTLIQNWLVARGVPAGRVKVMRLHTLGLAYNKERYLQAVLRQMRANGECDPNTVPDENDGAVPVPASEPTRAGEPEGAPAAPGAEAASGETDSAAADEDDDGEADDAAPVWGVPVAAPAVTDTADPVFLLAEAFRKLAAGSINEQRVIELIRRHANPGVKEISVQVNDGPQINVGQQHRNFEKLLRACSVKIDGKRTNVWLAGPAGAGKTTAAENVAKALGLKFYFNGAIDTEYKLLGFTNAMGEVVSRPFREAYIHGGVYLFDEVDRSLPGALLALNAALSTGWCDFPDGCFQRHPDLVVIAAGNTCGMGAGATVYSGAMKQDGAFLDRFAFMPWEIDEDCERAWCADSSWCGYVQRVRANVVKAGLAKDVVVSPRASIVGAAYLAAGFSRDDVIEMFLKKGMSAQQWERVA